MLARIEAPPLTSATPPEYLSPGEEPQEHARTAAAGESLQGVRPQPRPQQHAADRHRVLREAHIIAWLVLAWAGFFATLVLSWLAAFAYWRGITRLRPAATLGGLIAGRRRRLGALLGGLAHFALGTLGLPTLYAVAFAIAGRADAPLGAAFGLAHGILAGLVLPVAWRAAGNSSSAGLLGWRLGAATPFGLLAGHVLYGALIGYIYVVPPA